ncbi:MAG: hypothetical protein ABI887_03180 [Burkholderiales bacterium]
MAASLFGTAASAQIFPGVLDDAKVKPIVAPIAGSAAEVAASTATPARVAPSEADSPRSFAIPAPEIFGFDFPLNRYKHLTSGTADYEVSRTSIRRNLRGPWVTDNDPFEVNQVATTSVSPGCS